MFTVKNIQRLTSSFCVFMFKVSFFNNFSSIVTFPKEEYLDLTEEDDEKNKKKLHRRKTSKYFAEVFNFWFETT